MTTLRNFTEKILRLESFIRTRGMGNKGQLQYCVVATSSFHQWFLLRTLPYLLNEILSFFVHVLVVDVQQN